MRIPSAWTDQRVETLKKFWGDGLSAKQIAAEMGDGLTRNAVIGKAHRLGLAGRSKAYTRTGAARDGQLACRTRYIGAARKDQHIATRIVQRITRVNGTRITSGNVSGATKLAVVDAIEVVMPRTPENDLGIPLEQRRSILELTAETCRWPVGDVGTPGFFFCGGSTVTGRPYCAGHCLAAYRPVGEPREQQRPYLPSRPKAA